MAACAEVQGAADHERSRQEEAAVMIIEEGLPRLSGDLLTRDNSARQLDRLAHQRSSHPRKELLHLAGAEKPLETR